MDTVNGKRVLIADDEDGVRYLLASYMKDMGYNDIDSVCCGRAVKCLAGIDYDLVVLDISMPGCTGREAAHLLKSFNDRVKVLLITGHAYKDSEFGFPVLPKPFNSEELQAAIEVL